MIDPIDRQAAIDALQNEINKFTPPFNDVEGSIRCGVRLAKNIIEDLPSAEPEIIRCKDCKWCEDADGLMCKNSASWVVATNRDFGCVLAERRTDG